MVAGLVGWFVCALFASVAYHWTFYYLLALAVAPRDPDGPCGRRPARAGAPLRPHHRRGRGARMSEVVNTLLRGVRQLDERLTRRGDRRRILVDAGRR